jgi:hypothetical protein
MPTWDTFFAAQVGASAALAGLLFVGLSINMARIIKYPILVNRAFQALWVLVGVLLVSSLELIPGQPDLEFAIEILVVGSAIIGGSVYLGRRDFSTVPKEYRRPALVEAALLIVGLAFYVAGAILLILIGSNGLYVIVPAVLSGYCIAVLDAWVLLVEVNR